MKTKKCKKCELEKRLGEFYFYKDGRGYSGICIKCESERKQEWAKEYYKTHSQPNRQEVDADEYLRSHPDATKKCSGKCGEIKHLSEFGKNKNSSDGRKSECNVCRCEKQKIYYQKHKDEKKTYDIEYNIRNRDKKNKRSNEYYKNNKDKVSETNKKSRKKRERELIEAGEIVEYKKRKSEYNKAYYIKNKDTLGKKRWDRIKNDTQSKIAYTLRRRLKDALKGKKKVGSAVRNLGCSVKEVKERLEKMFYSHPETGEKMTWDNHGRYGWHIDHIIPLILFDLTDEKQIKIVCHYTNLQPLWAKHNLSKGNKIMTAEEIECLKKQK